MPSLRSYSGSASLSTRPAQRAGAMSSYGLPVRPDDHDQSRLATVATGARNGTAGAIFVGCCTTFPASLAGRS
jgi:hypothetical protein